MRGDESHAHRTEREAIGHGERAHQTGGSEADGACWRVVVDALAARRRELQSQRCTHAAHAGLHAIQPVIVRRRSVQPDRVPLDHAARRGLGKRRVERDGRRERVHHEGLRAAGRAGLPEEVGGAQYHVQGRA
ncbi:MAG: hypothetical protein JXA33_13290, partial [Anaerolineae bacterium]|nr:hypothetical protein [Anaerolineae bacterium]